MTSIFPVSTAAFAATYTGRSIRSPVSVRGLAVYLYSSPASVGDSGVGGQGWRVGG